MFASTPADKGILAYFCFTSGWLLAEYIATNTEPPTDRMAREDVSSTVNTSIILALSSPPVILSDPLPPDVRIILLYLCVIIVLSGLLLSIAAIVRLCTSTTNSTRG